MYDLVDCSFSKIATHYISKISVHEIEKFSYGVSSYNNYSLSGIIHLRIYMSITDGHKSYHIL